MTTHNDLLTIKRAISLVRTAADLFEEIGAKPTAKALRKYMKVHEPIVEQCEEDLKPTAKIVVLNTRRKDDETA